MYRASVCWLRHLFPLTVIIYTCIKLSHHTLLIRLLLLVCIDVPFLSPPWRLIYTSSLYNHCVVFISFVDFRFSIESALFYIHWLICRGCFFLFLLARWVLCITHTLGLFHVDYFYFAIYYEIIGGHGGINNHSPRDNTICTNRDNKNKLDA